MIFKPIQLPRDRAAVIQFQKDSFYVSFGEEQHFNEEEYVNWLSEQLAKYPEGCVLIEENGKPIGQIELSIREYKGERIGYVHLFYLIAGERGNGKGKWLQSFAEDFFRRKGLRHYHLRVSPTNLKAVKFYKKNGLVEIGPELYGKVIRMMGVVP
ncbi:GNAT family N-acetyltransferase [Halobacillus sp. B23F22_1]|uniref:GNAT family N-acetyltransferase n=1 Tax=Halobacillus sp. B23F22_1 TaxID=3459514 RepID=UPI00373F9E68